MRDVDREILDTARQWLRVGHTVALTTVAATWGSSPRPVGSLMTMRKDGRHAGSVSGGCVEDDLIARYRSGSLAEPLPTVIDYGVDRAEASRLGLPCGGRLELVIEQLNGPNALDELMRRIDAGELVVRRVSLETGEVSVRPAARTDDFLYDRRCLEKVFGPRWQMLLIGAGHLSRYVAEFALALDYHVMVCDPREDYVDTWQVAGSDVTRAMPDDAVRALAQPERSIVVTLTHDPKLDDLALIEALNAQVYYVGALGSRRSNEKRRERLAAMGVTDRQMARLHAPVGIAIGSRTPAEIAVSILAEVTAVRRGTDAERHARRPEATRSTG